MSVTHVGETRVRLWLGVAIVALQWLVRFLLPSVWAEGVPAGVIGGLVGGLLVIAWWAFFSRAPWRERLGGIAVLLGVMLATSVVIDRSLATGMMGLMFPVFAMPVVSLAFVGWAVFSYGLRWRPGATGRWAALVLAMSVASGAWAVVRTEGITGNANAKFAWRWSKTREERLVASAALPAAAASAVVADRVVSIAAATAAAPTPVEPIKTAALRPTAIWPGFRGAGRNGALAGVRIETDWAKSAPVELWRREVGPGWGSFAVSGDRIYTQEQRGEDEMVTCYDAITGKPVWAHRDATRFWESNGGAGPRGTPTLDGGRVYAFGATGILNALDAATGALAWSRNAASDTGRKTPTWGFAASPLVVGDLVVIATAGQLAAYDRATGAPRWMGPAGPGGYSSPHLVTLGGVEQILFLSGEGATSVSPADGKVLWKHAWPDAGFIVQPAVTADGDLLLAGGEGVGLRRIAVTQGARGWTTEVRWTTKGLKPYFNDFVVHEGYVFGFDGSILACVDLKDGARKWKGGRYGHGQFVLLRDQGVLVVLSEDGELALVKASPTEFTELARVRAIEGKTWNHPVLAGDRLLVRNGSEMVAFRVSTR